jgi:hypothetical protein
MRNQSGVRLYNITVDGVHDTASSRQLANESPSFVFGFDLNNYSSPKSPYSTIRIGQDGYYTDRETELGDVFGIHVSNIHSRTNCSILLNENIKDSYFGNIYAGKNVHRVVTTKSCRKHQTYGCDMQNVVFENIFYSPDADNEAVAFDFDVNTEEETLREVARLVAPEKLIVWLYMNKPNFAWLAEKAKVTPENVARVRRYARLGIANVNNPIDAKEAFDILPDILEV